MGMAQAIQITGQVQRFQFQLTDTIGDIAMVVRQLEKEGRSPHLRFVGLANEDISGVEILGLAPEIQLTPAGRNAVEEAAEEQPDPAGLAPAIDLRLRGLLNDVRWAGVTDDTPVFFDGRWTEWGTLAGNERQECAFNADGDLIGCLPF